MPTTILFSCPKCRTKIEVPTALAGRKGKCKGCGEPVHIPVPSNISARPAPVEAPAPDALDEFEEDDVAEPIAEAPSRSAPSPKKRNHRSAARTGEETAAIIYGVGAGLIGFAGLFLGLFLVEMLILGLKLFGISGLDGQTLGLVVLVGLAFWDAIFGLARFLLLLQPNASPEQRRGTTALLTLVLAVILGGLRAATPVDKLSGLGAIIGIFNPPPVNVVPPTPEEARAKYRAQSKLLRGPSQATRDKAVREIGYIRVMGMAPGRAEFEEIRDAFPDLLQSTTEEEALASLIFTIGQLGREEEVELLQPYLNDPRAGVAKSSKSAVSTIEYNLKGNVPPYLD